MEMTDNSIFIHGQASLVKVKILYLGYFTPFLLYMIIGNNF